MRIALPEPDDDAYLQDMVKELTAIMSTEWLEESEYLSQEILVPASFSTFPCRVSRTMVDGVYNPLVGANIMSLTLARSILGKVPLIPTTRTLRYKENVNLECEGVAANVTIYYADVGARLNFYIFDIQDFDLLIGYPVERLFVDTLLSGTLDVKLG